MPTTTKKSASPKTTKTSPRIFHLHVENSRKRQPLFQLTEPIYAAAVKRHRELAKQLKVTIGWDGDILDEQLKTADFLIYSNPPRERLRERAPQLQWIQTTGAGIDGLLPLDWLPPDITLTNNSGAHGDKAEDYCAMALLMLQARMPAILANQRDRKWEPIFTMPIESKTAVVIGFGDLGSAAGRAAHKLGLKVIAVTRSGKAGKPADLACKVERIESVLPKADFVIVTTPLTAGTKSLLNRARLDLMKPSAGLINIGRSPVVDYDALLDKLEKNELAGAVLDVHSPEPLPAEASIWSARNVIITPHISCDDPRYMEFLCDAWFANFARKLSGRPLTNQVDRKLGY
jgi:phosphoglycerate dehydrogenase-like enzyme